MSSGEIMPVKFETTRLKDGSVLLMIVSSDLLPIRITCYYPPKNATYTLTMPGLIWEPDVNQLILLAKTIRRWREINIDDIAMSNIGGRHVNDWSEVIGPFHLQAWLEDDGYDDQLILHKKVSIKAETRDNKERLTRVHIPDPGDYYTYVVTVIPLLVDRLVTEGIITGETSPVSF